MFGWKDFALDSGIDSEWPGVPNCTIPNARVGGERESFASFATLSWSFGFSFLSFGRFFVASVGLCETGRRQIA